MIYREAFERNCRSVELTPDHVPDINVITGVLKDYLRELPEPLFTRCLFQMTVDALGKFKMIQITHQMLQNHLSSELKNPIANYTNSILFEIQ